MANPPRRVCWDAWAFTELLNRFSAHHEHLKHIAAMAAVKRNPEVEIVTSSLAIAEVAGLLKHSETGQVVGQLDVTEIARMWRTARITRLDVTRAVARQARDIVRGAAAERPQRKLIDGSDAIYLATASILNADTLVTGDKALLAHSGVQSVRICLPPVLYFDLNPVLRPTESP